MSNPVSKIRDEATKKFIDILKLVKAVDADACGLWPGIDGYTYPDGHMFYQMWENFEGALADAMDEVPGVMVRIENQALRTDSQQYLPYISRHAAVGARY